MRAGQARQQRSFAPQLPLPVLCCAERIHIVKGCRARFSGQDARGGGADAERWITKRPQSVSIDASSAGRAGQPLHTLLRAVQALNERGAAFWALLQTLGFSSVWVEVVSAVLPYSSS